MVRKRDGLVRPLLWVEGLSWPCGAIGRVTAMLTRRPSSKETTTLCWGMPDDAWAHWTQGRGEKSVRDVILEGIDQIRKSPEAVKNIRKRCEGGSQEDQGEHEVGQALKHKIEIQLPAGGWAAACQRVGPIDDMTATIPLAICSRLLPNTSSVGSKIIVGSTIIPPSSLPDRCFSSRSNAAVIFS